jgi:hypothetical protein
VSNLTITIELPEELVERAKKIGLELDSQSEQVVALIEAQIQKRESAMRFSEIGRRLQALSANLKLTPEEIEAEIRAYRAENSVADVSDNS